MYAVPPWSQILLYFITGVSLGHIYFVQYMIHMSCSMILYDAPPKVLTYRASDKAKYVNEFCTIMVQIVCLFYSTGASKYQSLIW